MNEDSTDRNKYNLSPGQKTVIAPVSSDMVALSEKKAEEDAKIYIPPTEEELEAKRIAEEEKKKAEQEKKEAYIDPLANFQADNDKEVNLTTTENISNTNQTEPHASLFGTIAGSGAINMKEESEKTQKNTKVESDSSVSSAIKEALNTAKLPAENQSFQEAITTARPVTLNNNDRSKIRNKEKISILIAYIHLALHLSIFYLLLSVLMFSSSASNPLATYSIISSSIILVLLFAASVIAFIPSSIVGFLLGKQYRKTTGNKSIGMIFNSVNFLLNITIILIYLFKH